MKVIYVKDYQEMSLEAFKIIKETIENKNNATISMTTGGTPRGLFKYLVEAINTDSLDISKTTFMNLDEYVGPMDDVYTVNRFMHENFYNQIKTQPQNKFLINGAAKDTEEEIKRYANILAAYPRDVQICGLGTNGHIGANEPGTPFDSTIFLAQHDESTILSTMKEYNIERDVAPTEMITLGFTEILAAKKVVLMVSGTHKADAVKKIIEGDINTDVPASYLKDKDNVIMIIDEDAASLLKK